MIIKWKREARIKNVRASKETYYENYKKIKKEGREKIIKDKKQNG